MSKSGRQRSTRAVSAEEYVGAAMRDLGEWFITYKSAPDFDTIGVAFERILRLALLEQAEHRHGVAGGIEGILRLQPDRRRDIRRAWPRIFELADPLRPADLDADIRKATEIDWLWMVALVTGDSAPLDRIVRLGRRRDPIGDAALMILHVHSALPQVVEALARAAQQLALQQPPPVPEKRVPSDAVKALAQAIALDPDLRPCVLHVGWEPQTGAPGDTPPGRFVLTTPDGKMPVRAPKTWEGMQVVARMATISEMQRWRDERRMLEMP